MRLSVIIPAFNEEKRIGETLRKIRAYFLEKKIDGEILAVDDGSLDGTADVVREEFRAMAPVTCRLLLNGRNCGKGFSVRRGVLESKGERVLFTDADLSTPIEELARLEAVLAEGFDIAVGSRALAGSRVEVHQNVLRENMGKIYNRIARGLTFKDILDSQCGFKLFKKNAAYDLFGSSRIDGFSFDAEILYLAQKKGYKIKEVPVVWRNSAASKVEILRDPIAMFWELFLIRIFHG